MLVTIIFVLVVIGVAFLWGFIAKKFEKRYNTFIQTKKGKMIIILGACLLQLALVIIFSFQFRSFFIDTLFVFSFVLSGIAWLYSYFRTYSVNQQKVINKQYGGDYSVGEIRVFKLALNPLLIGIYSFSIIGIAVSFLYYLPYFF
ncbi:hypothetical protein [Heyndrickxia vini]|uniref:DUF3899 domain-containing protein n=1 Tax=Heyndrickxia vini TaxID=1476025 RepID=A0ABX7E2F4_9BACI|nr:hypothetical protein [Heyndrickxia vini]QQZ09901.1 hypothetical protein I5776_02705 [Heyndrickxia vini]